MRQPHPWYSETRSGGGWFVKLSGEQHFLGKQPVGLAKPAKRNGRWNPPSEILAEYHKLMVARDTASKADYIFDNICALHIEELEQANPELAKRYKQIIEKFSDFVDKGRRIGNLERRAAGATVHESKVESTEQALPQIWLPRSHRHARRVGELDSFAA